MKRTSGYESYTVDQIRRALDNMEHNYSLALDANEPGLAVAMKSKIDGLMDELKRRSKQVSAEEIMQVF